MLSRLWTQIEDLAILAAISLAFGIVKLIYSPEAENLKLSCASLFLSVIVGTIAGSVALAYNLGDYIALSCSSTASLLARDLILAILQNNMFFGSLIKRGAENLTDKLTK